MMFGWLNTVMWFSAGFGITALYVVTNLMVTTYGHVNKRAAKSAIPGAYIVRLATTIVGGLSGLIAMAGLKALHPSVSTIDGFAMITALVFGAVAARRCELFSVSKENGS